MALSIGAAGALCGAGVPPVLAAPEAPSEPSAAAAQAPATGVSPSDDSPWVRLLAAVSEIEALETVAEHRHILDGVREGLARLGPAYAARVRRLDRVDELVQEQAWREPSLLVETVRSLGALRLRPEEVTVFAVEREALETGRRELEEQAEYLRATHRTRSADDRRRTFEALRDTVTRAADQLTQHTGRAAKDGCAAQTPAVEMDPTIEPTPEGLEALGRDRALLREDLETFRLYGVVCSRYVLTSDRYGSRGGPSIFDVALGAFEPYKPACSPLVYGLHSLNMAPTSEIGAFGHRITTFHEAFGHGTSVLANPALANLLTEEQLVERATFEMQIMNNPDWAARDGSIPELFRPYPSLGSLERFIAEAEVVEPEQLGALIRRYPMRRLTESVSVQVRSSAEPRARDEPLILKVDSLLDVAAASGRPALRSITRLERPEQVYESWEAFLAAYLPLLAADATAGNVRARVLWAGLSTFSRELGNDAMQLDPVASGEDRSGAAWTRRVNTAVANVVVYHLFLNGAIDGTDYRAYFTSSERQELERRVYEKRMLYRGELWADGIAYAHQLGERLRANPYRDALRHAASMLV